jgi:hypothetical protein
MPKVDLLYKCNNILGEGITFSSKSEFFFGRLFTVKLNYQGIEDYKSKPAFG